MSVAPGGRNLRMVERVSRSPVDHPFSFAIAGDSGAWPDPTADAIFGQLVRQIEALRPAPLFFANLGDFAGPGTRERHEHYLGLVAPLSIANFCVIGNHDLDDPTGDAAWTAVHGARNLTFAYGRTRFVVLDAAPGERGRLAVATPEGVAGPRDEALAFLDRALGDAPEPHRVVLMHAPPRLDGHYAPHPEWGFDLGEEAFLALVRRHRVSLVCCAHGLAFDHHVHDGVHYVMSGGGGTALCSHRAGVCTEGPGTPEDRGALFHFVQIVVGETGAIRGHVHQAFAPTGTPPRITFSGPPAGER
jgi:hypothetical protein